jgi:calcineurin-like phosphoesterase
VLLVFLEHPSFATTCQNPWDGAEGWSVHDDPRVLRPLNIGANVAGRGAGIVTSSTGMRLGVVNVAGHSAIPVADDPLEVLERHLEGWEVDAVLVDFHGESVFEKTSIAYALEGRIAALLGTHTHVQTNDARVLNDNVAFVSDVGMTGPSGGAQGYDPTGFVTRFRTRGLHRPSLELATGEVELGAVLVELEGSSSVGISRLSGAEAPTALTLLARVR